MNPSWIAFCSAAMLMAFVGCEKPKIPTGKTSPPDAQTSAAEEAEDLSAEEKTAIKAAKPFLDAVAGRDYAKAYSLLSTHGKARMSANQFTQPDDDAQFDSVEVKALANPTEQDFATFMKSVEKLYGTPSKIIDMTVMSTDPTVLAGKGDVIENAFTIGNIPASVPVAIRKASVRSQIGTKLSPTELKKIAEQEGMTVEELQKSEDFEPYFSLKTVLVDENGELKVGYFEFTPPSMMD